MTPQIDIAIEDDSWQSLSALDALVEQAVAAAMAEAGATLRADCELSVAFVGDAQSRALNAQWRGIDKPTNVLSFPGGDAPQMAMLLGDIVIAHGVVTREAREQEIALRDHVAHMVVHGFLHLLGYDHETDAQALDMEARETRALARLGVADPYAGSEPAPAAPRRQAGART